MVGDDRRYKMNELLCGSYPDGNPWGILDEYYHQGCRFFIIDNLGKIA